MWDKIGKSQINVIGRISQIIFPSEKFGQLLNVLVTNSPIC